MNSKEPKSFVHFSSCLEYGRLGFNWKHISEGANSLPIFLLLRFEVETGTLASS
jgi:hypothetical protein